MYIGGNSIIQMKAFIDGWLFSGIEVTDKSILDEFQLWIQSTYRITSNQSWDRIILFYSTDSFEALENFFKLFEEFLSERSDGSSNI